jgi:hypothetical protein
LSIPEGVNAELAAVCAYSSLRDVLRDSRLVRFEDLADALAQLDAVAVERNVAACHHDAGVAAGDGMKEKGRGGNPAGIFDVVARVDDRAGAGTHDALGARPQIAREDYARSGTCITTFMQIPKRALDVDVGLEIRDVLDEPAETARAERQGDGNVIEKRCIRDAGIHRSLMGRPAAR